MHRKLDSIYVEALKMASEISHLPFVERVKHVNLKRMLRFIVVCGSVSVFGGSIFCYAKELGDILVLHHLVIEISGATIHAIGVVPLVKVLEPTIIMLAGLE